MHNFVIEKLNTIDDEYVLQKYLVPNNHFVKKGQSFVEIETSKIAVELDAPCDGFIVRKVDENSKIKVGDIICSFFKDKLSDAQLTNVKLINKKNINKTKKIGFNVSRSFNNLNKDQDNIKQINKYLDIIIPKDPYKSAETKNLLEVNFASLVSCLHKEIQTTERVDEQQDLFENNISDLIIYETSILIKKYKKINSHLQPNGELKIYDYVNFGYTIDVDDKLNVVNLGETNKLDLDSIRAKIQDSIVSATIKKFTTNQSKTSTITLSDLSSNSLLGFYPLIPSKSSCTIGLSKPSVNKNIISFSFDHRIISGQYASNFLNDLEKNVLKHFKINSIIDSDDSTTFTDDYECYFCGKDLKTSKASGELGFLKVLTNNGQEKICCRICFEGW
jgi:pyruvate/2-oxoglutarate dehydrogenase complex dihydrolipoamide acyltransferase (E2) component|tara:strand:+ start:2691 stop:3860 length:1170 start_codon:yes stop_codon:yes gene_type:complete